jgi:hypothetical protein
LSAHATAAFLRPPDEYDLLTSVFGVMFFDDRVAAFTNLRMVRVSACPVLCG